eukprot:scaffold10075_cov65-Phaeocystis_antarctica.AAC.4
MAAFVAADSLAPPWKLAPEDCSRFRRASCAVARDDTTTSRRFAACSLRRFALSAMRASAAGRTERGKHKQRTAIPTSKEKAEELVQGPHATVHASFTWATCFPSWVSCRRWPRSSPRCFFVLPLA